MEFEQDKIQLYISNKSFYYVDVGEVYDIFEYLKFDDYQLVYMICDYHQIFYKGDFIESVRCDLKNAVEIFDNFITMHQRMIIINDIINN
jgi:hypothetical protein